MTGQREPLLPDPFDDHCPTCQGQFWHVRLAKWVYSRETVNMVCQTCGRDYSAPDDEGGDG